eukprot:428361-Amphidinium_carterae.1
MNEMFWLLGSSCTCHLVCTLFVNRLSGVLAVVRLSLDYFGCAWGTIFGPTVEVNRPVEDATSIEEHLQQWADGGA